RGGICNYLRTVTLTNRDVSWNETHGNANPGPSVGGGGGGGCDSSNCIPFQSSKSQIFAIMGGGGIYNSQGTMTLTNATISGNSASSVSSQFAGGGGILNDEGTASLTNTTLFGNSAPPPVISSSAYSGGGGINTIAGTLIIKNSILANNLQGKNCGKYLGGGSSWGYTLSDDASCA